MSLTTIDPNRGYDVLVVGNGVLGLSLGLVLARRGVSVAVVGDPARPFAASAAAGAMNGCFGEVTPVLLASAHGRTKLDLDYRATGMWGDWAASIVEQSDETSLRSATGTVVILNTVGVPQIDSDGYAAIRAALRQYGEPYEDLDAQQVPWLRPDPMSRPLQAMFLPNEHGVNAPALLRGLATAVTTAGGHLIGEHITDLVLAGGRVTGVEMGSGAQLSAPTVVLAAGAASHQLLRRVPREITDRIPAVVAGMGVALLLETEDGTMPDSVIRTPNRAFACGLHAVPREDGHVYIGATNDILAKPRRTAAVGDLTLLFGCTRQIRTDLGGGHIEKILVGNRPVPLDGFPLLGEAGVPGLWMMTGTYRDGLHQSPLLATEMAARILGEAYAPELDMFPPVRPPIQPLTREECLELAVRHTMATGYEHAWQLPEDWPPMIEDQMRRWYSGILDEIDEEFIPLPEFLGFVQPEIHAQLRTYYNAHRGASSATVPAPANGSAPQKVLVGD
jgi:glycine oxidase